MKFTQVLVIIEAVLEGDPTETELFSESVKKKLEGTEENCPGFIVASSEEGLRKQHPSLDTSFNIHTLLIQPDVMKSVDMTKNMHFSYSSARDAYTVYDPETSPNKSRTHNWQSYAAGYGFQWQKVVDWQQYQTKTSLDFNTELGGEISWKFQSKPGEEIEVNNLLVYVNSDDDVKWHLKIWTSENQLDPIDLSPKEEKFDKLNQTVSRMKLTAQLSGKTGKIFEENMLKNQVSMVVAINKATDMYLNDKGYLNDDLPAPSTQNKKKAFALFPDQKDMFIFELTNKFFKAINKAMISDNRYRSFRNMKSTAFG